MGDCPNVEMRDALPDLLHPAMSLEMRALVQAHVATCPECSAELALLRRVRQSGEGSPVNVDADRVVSALPSPARSITTWKAPSLWKIAATIALLVGAVSYGAIEYGTRESENLVPLPVAMELPRAPDSSTVAAAPVGTAPEPSPSTPRLTRSPSGLSLGGGLDDFSDAELQSLLSALDSFEAEVRIEPESVVPILRSEEMR